MKPIDLLHAGLPQTFNFKKTQYMQNAVEQSPILETRNKINVKDT